MMKCLICCTGDSGDDVLLFALPGFDRIASAREVLRSHLNFPLGYGISDGSGKDHSVVILE